MECPPKDIQAIAIEGGGACVAAAIGALVALEDAGRLNNLKVMVGTSSGALPCVLRAAGWTFKEIYKGMIHEIDITRDITEGCLKMSFVKQMWYLFRQYGLCQGKAWHDFIGRMIGRHVHNNNPDVTLSELQRISGITLLIPASGYDQRLHVFSPHLTHGDMPARTSIIATTRIPGLFTPVQIGNCMYFDGGMTCNFGLRLIDRYFPDLVPYSIGLRYDMSYQNELGFHFHPYEHQV